MRVLVHFWSGDQFLLSASQRKSILSLISTQPYYPALLTRKVMSAQIGPLEMHVPCRAPIQHLLSQCNMLRIKFNCSSRDPMSVEEQIRRCLVQPFRFSVNILKYQNITVKCFDPVPPHHYINYTSQRLQRKCIENSHIQRDTNKPRNKLAECLLLEENKELHNLVYDMMVTAFPYYRFCDACMKSEETRIV
mmetsp:Transcript_38366/g.93171  ORF Transcript_38366/g.93171 Transcript_38366/m.93171 type:complete len:192 (+) Transcript_38366:1880-2455(+)